MSRFMKMTALCFLMALAPPGMAAKKAPERNTGRKLPAAGDAFAGLAPRQISDGRNIAPMYLGYNSPHLIQARGKLWFAFQNSFGRPIVMTYEPMTKTWDGPVIAADQGLEKDDHGNPALAIDAAGFLHVFYGCHGGAMRHAVSAKPWDIRAWADAPSPAPRATYPQVVMLKGGTMCLFYRAGGHPEPWSMRRSTDNGKTWSAEERVIEMRLDPPDKLACAYAQFIPGAGGKTVHCLWVHKDDNAARVTPEKPHPWRPLKYPGLNEAVYRYNIYYARRDGDGAWRSGAGEALKLPVTKAEADAKCMVFDSGDQFTFGGSVALDAQDRPYIKFATGVVDWVKSAGGVKGVTQGNAELVPRTDRFAALAGGTWKIEKKEPAGWPAEIRAQLGAPGVPAHGEAWPRADWFIDYTRTDPSTGFGSVVFLWHEGEGYVKRQGGPVKVD